MHWYGLTRPVSCEKIMSVHLTFWLTSGIARVAYGSDNSKDKFVILVCMLQRNFDNKNA